MKPIVSVLLTAYNREAFLSDALESVLKSSFENFEIVVVDDNSSDKSLQIAKQIAKQDNRVRVYSNEKNLGDYPNRMMAASMAKGRYLKYVDSDDLIYSHSLELMVESMERYPDAALALCHSMPEDESPYPWMLTPEQAYQKHFLSRGCLSCGPSGAIIRRVAFEEIGGFRPKWEVISDTDLWYRMAARWPTVLLPPGLVWWRRHESQEYTQNDARLSYLRRGNQLIAEALASSDCPLSDADRNLALSRARQHFARHLWSLALKQSRPGQAFGLYADSDLKLTELIAGLQSYK